MENNNRTDDKCSDQKHYLFDEPKNVKRLLNIFYSCCILLFALDFVIHRHIAHSWENLWGFYPIYGFIGCVILVLVATWMRSFLMRDEDYYDPQDSTHNEVNGEGKQTKMNQTVKGENNVDA